MGILSREALNPTRFNVQDPFAMIVTEVENWLLVKQPDYLYSTWPTVKRDYLKRILGLDPAGTRNGLTLRHHATVAPTDELSDTLLAIYDLIDHSVYFTSKYWRAFYYWVKYGKTSSCWPQFSQREIDAALTVLQSGDIAILKTEAEKEWVDFFANGDEINSIFRKIKKPLLTLCYTRVSFLSKYDPALYSIEDLVQYARESILVSLRNNDYIPKDPNRVVGWALKCADNAIHNLRIKALAKKRGFFLHQEESVDTPDVSECLHISSATPDAWYFPTVEDQVQLQELLSYADPKIGSYLRTVCGGEHNPDFWSWFCTHEPKLAQKAAYVEENPEALGPYLQRHLNLSTHQLTSFLKAHLPSLLEKVSDTPLNRAILAYAS